MPLTITRRVAEKLFIGKDIEILVTRISDGQVRLAIKAPRSIPIMREELLTRLSRRAAK
jgi:carbon storage regulator